MVVPEMKLLGSNIQQFATPSIWEALLYGIALYAVTIPLSAFLRKRMFRAGLPVTPLDVPGLRALRAVLSWCSLEWLFPKSAGSYRRAYRNPGVLNGPVEILSSYLFAAVEATNSELLFRGLPFVAAITIGFSPLVAVTCGTLLEASIDAPRWMPLRLIMGAYFGWLWLSGVWYLALAIPVVIGWLLITVGHVRSWTESGHDSGWAA